MKNTTYIARQNNSLCASALQITSRVTLISLSAALLTVAAVPQIQQRLTGDLSWVASGNLGTARAGQTATLLPSGKVLVAGGNNTSVLNSAEVYDPATGTWTATGSMLMPRSRHTATLLPSGEVVVAGGVRNGGALRSTELYDPAN